MITFSQVTFQLVRISVLPKNTASMIRGMVFILLSTLIFQSFNLNAQAPFHLEWGQNYGGSLLEIPESVIQTVDNGFITAGLSTSSDGDVGGNNGSADFWIVKSDVDGIIEWEQNFGGVGLELAYTITLTNDGGYVICGSSTSSDGDVGGNNGGGDLWIIKLDNSGNLVWERNFGGSQDDTGFDVQATFDGGLIVAATSRSNDGDVSGNFGLVDFWILKLDPNGSLIWEQNYGGTRDEIVRAVQQTSDGGYLVGGSSRSSDGDVGANGGLYDYWVIRIDPNGALLWEQNYGGSQNDLLNDLVLTSDGGAALLGTTSSNDGDVSSNNGADDFWLVRIDPNGMMIWESNYGGSATDDGRSITLTPNSGFLLHGSTSSSDGDVGDNNGLSDYWLASVDDMGVLLWEQNLGGLITEFGSSHTQTRDGGFLVAGRSSSADGDVGGNNGGSDNWLVKFTPCDISITCPRNTLVECGDEADPAFTGRPTAQGPLSATFSYEDSIGVNTGTPISYTIYRTWTATNPCDSTATCVQLIDIVDRTPPTIINCPADIRIDLSEAENCDTTLFWLPPTAEEFCELYGFTGGFDPSLWMLGFNGPGGGGNGTATFNAAKDSLEIMGSSNGTAGQNTNTDICITIMQAGELGFDWIAEAMGGGAQLLNDEAAFVINGTETILATGTGSMQAGTVASLDLEVGDEFCYRVRSNNQFAISRFEITEFWFTPAVTIEQVSGPLPDTLPTMMGGDTLTAGRYTVRYEATDDAGNVSTCDFNIILDGTDDMACEDINVSLDENCGVRVHPAMVLTSAYNCVEAFEIEIFHHGVAIGDSIDLTYLGETLDYTVTDPGSLNSCWGKILVEDKFEPEFICNDDTLNCIEFQFQVDTPDVIEFCQDYEVFLVDELITNHDCDEEFIKFVTRKWIAEDESGNTSDTCIQSIWISRFPMGDLEGPVQDTTVYCGSGFPITPAGRPMPSATGTPTLDNMSLFPLPDFFCNVIVEFEDFPMSGAGCTERFMRQWKVTEWWCNQDSIRRFNQIITIVDTVGPTISLFQDTITAKAGQRSCDAMVHLPTATVNDVCHSVDRVDMVYPGGFSGDQNGGHVRLPVGINAVVYRAFDSCYNMTTDTLFVIVDDGVAPVAICDQNTSISLNIFGTANLRAEALDDGSFDECELDRVEVRRMTADCTPADTVWGESVDFCCADVGAGDIMVALRAIDKSGNENMCMVRVDVQDKQAPQVIGLPTIIVDCRFDWDPNNLDVFGKFVFDPADRDSIIIDAAEVRFIGDPLDGIILDNCPPVVEEEVDMNSLDQCGIGFIVRLFTFTDGQGNQSTWSQSIFFEDNNPFADIQINWPNHLDTSNVCGINNFLPEMLSDSFAFPIFIDEDECSLVGYDYKDEIHDASIGNEACFRIIRHWTVIDWCQTEKGIHKKWTYDQVIDVSNTNAPTILNVCADTVRCVVSATCTPDTFELIGLANDDCTDSLDLFWRIKIDEFNDGSIDHVILSNDATGVYPFGVHKAKYIVEDLCGNQDSCEFIFELRNCKAPTAYCRNGLIAELTPIDTNGDGTLDIEFAEVMASEFDENSSHICGHPVVLSFSADTLDTLRTYDCDSLVPPFRDVTIWVTDRITGETARCVTFVNVQDNNMEDVCGMTLTGTVSGLISTHNDKMIDAAEVYLENMNGQMSLSDQQGSYSFNTLPLGSNFIIEPHKDTDYTNGVSTADLVTIQRHLLGKKVFQTPELYIAADVNNTEGVTAADIAALRKVILGVKEEFDNNESWRFVDKNYQFPNALNPWEEEFPESYTVSPFEQDMRVDFRGIKIGDVTGDVEVGPLRGKNETRSYVDVQLSNQSLIPGRTVEVPLYLEWIEEVSGFQYTLEWNPKNMELIQVVPNFGIEMDLGNFGLNRIEEGMLTASWHTTSTIRLPSEKQKVMGVLVFEVKREGNLSEALHLTSAITKNEVYFKNDAQSTQLQLTFDGEVEEGYFALYQNVPNPWSELTLISFNLVKEEKVMLTVFNDHGQNIQTVEIDGNQGYNEVELKLEQVLSGVYYYRLETDRDVDTKKMIVIR